MISIQLIICRRSTEVPLAQLYLLYRTFQPAPVEKVTDGLRQ